MDPAPAPAGSLLATSAPRGLWASTAREVYAKEGTQQCFPVTGKGTVNLR